MFDLKQRGYSEWLVIRCQQGERDAFTELVSLWQRRFYLYAMRRLGEREAARDVTQECLLSISRSLGELSDPAAFPKWSFRILERRCIDWQRKRIREREVFNEDSPLPELAIDDTKEEQLTISKLLARLDPDVAAVLRLYYLEGLSVDDIAVIYGLPTGTVKSRLFYARKLVSKLAEEKP